MVSTIITVITLLEEAELTPSFACLFHAILVYVQRKQHVRVPVFFFCDVWTLATVASRYGCVQKPGGLLWGRSTQFRLILELENVWDEEKLCEYRPCRRNKEGQRARQEASVSTLIILCTMRILCLED